MKGVSMSTTYLTRGGMLLLLFEVANIVCIDLAYNGQVRRVRTFNIGGPPWGYWWKNLQEHWMVVVWDLLFILIYCPSSVVVVWEHAWYIGESELHRVSFRG